MSKKDEALKMALPDRRIVTSAGNPEDYINSGWNECLDAIREALASHQPAQGCEFCSHPLYAGTKCKNCGCEQLAQQEPKQSEIFCGVDFADGMLSVSVLRRRNDDVAELLHLEQIALPAQQQYQSTADKCELTPVPAKGGLLPAQQDIPKIGCVNHDCDKCKAQQQQEPGATDWERIARVQDAKLRAMCDEPGGFEKLCEVMDKYERTSPPASKPWVGLTSEDKVEILRANGEAAVLILTEAKLREKNA